MEDHLKLINIEQKLSAEEHLLLLLYAKYNGKEKLLYKNLLIHENLINRFNKTMTNEYTREKFAQYIKKYDENDVAKFIDIFNEKPWKYAKPIIWKDRKRTKYYIDNLTLSHRFEIFIERKFQDKGINLGLFYGREEQYNKGENELGIEIKRDMMAADTGNLYIEYMERLNPNGDWVLSGIFKKDNTNYFLIGDINKFWILRKIDLKELYLKIEENGGRLENGCRIVEARRGTSKGFLLPTGLADKKTLSLDKLIEIIK